MKAAILIVGVVVGVTLPVLAERPGILLAERPGDMMTVCDAVIGQSPTQSPNFSLESFAEKIITSLGSSAFMALLCYYMITKALPAKDAQLEKAQTAFQEEAQRQRDENRVIVDRLVKHGDDQTEAVLEIVRSCPNNKAK